VALLRPVSPALTVLVALALVAPPRLDLHAAAIDTQVTTQGLRARVADLDDWTITVGDAATDAATQELAVEVWLRAPDGSDHRRRLPLAGTTTEDRSRELAASLALLIEQWDERSPSPPPAPSSARVPDTRAPGPMPAAAPRARAWLGLGPRLELGRSLLEGGLDVQGGAWLLREHLQPLASLGWSASASAGLSLHTLRLGLGLAAGAPLPRSRMWLGAHALAHGAWTTANDRRNASTWASSSELGALMQIRWPRWQVGVRTGVDLALPPLKVKGDHARLQRGPAQFVLAVQIGLIFG
jgi:hypothetical protein